MMSELEQALIGDSAAAPPSHILEGLPADLVHRNFPGAPHTIYQELWHIAFWQQMTLDWIDGVETPFPAHPSAGFPTLIAADGETADGETDNGETANGEAVNGETWEQLCQRFLDGSHKAAGAARDAERLEQSIRCPSRPGAPMRTMSVRDQLVSLAAHNAYHFGRIVLLRQLGQAWPPPSGGFSW